MMAPVGPFQSLPELLAQRATTSPSAVAFMSRDADGVWRAMRWHSFSRAVGQLAANLRAYGLKPGDQVGVLMPNGIEWETIQHAVYRLSGVVVGLDLNDPSERMRQVFSLCSPSMLFVDNLDRLKQIPAPMLDRIKVVSTGYVSKSEREMAGCSITAMDTLAGAPCTDAPPSIDPHALATILFTSGTTGHPKAIAYTHSQIALAVDSIIEHFSDLPEQAHTACWLPLANPFQRIINFCAMAMNWKTFMVPTPAAIMTDVKEIEPHLFAAVPRFYEKLYDGIRQGIGQMPKGLQMLAHWAQRAGRAHRQAMAKGKKPSWRLRLTYGLADRVVLKRIRRVMGANLKYFISGSAAMNRVLIETFGDLGWQVLEAYGISENIVPMAMNFPDAARPGSVGRPLTANMLSIADDGEILVKGQGVAARTVVLTEDGFLKTGDLGKLDPEGFLYLTGRKSDMFKLSTGRKVIPQTVEEAVCPMEPVEHCVALGSNQKFVVLLLNIPKASWDALTEQHNGTEGAMTYLREQARQACRHLPQYCRPVDIMVVHDIFSPQTGELTANLKLKRRKVLDKYSGAIDELYRRIEERSEWHTTS